MPLARLYDKLGSNSNNPNVYNENSAIKYKNYLFFELK